MKKVVKKLQRRENGAGASRVEREGKTGGDGTEEGRKTPARAQGAWPGRHVLAVERFDLAFQFDLQWTAAAVEGLGGRDLDPAFADAIFFHVKAFLVVEADADVVLEHGGNVVRAARVDRQAIGQWG